MSKQTLTGSCLCGAVRYTATGEVQRFYHCHCSRCRKATGTGHATNLFMKGSLTLDAGEELIKTFKLPEADRFSNTFCRNCGGRVAHFVPDYDIVFIPAGSLDVEPEIKPQARIFTDSRAGWSCDATALPEFEQYAG